MVSLYSLVSESRTCDQMMATENENTNSVLNSSLFVRGETVYYSLPERAHIFATILKVQIGIAKIYMHKNCQGFYGLSHPLPLVRVLVTIVIIQIFLKPKKSLYLILKNQ